MRHKFCLAQSLYRETPVPAGGRLSVVLDWKLSGPYVIQILVVEVYFPSAHFNCFTLGGLSKYFKHRFLSRYFRSLCNAVVLQSTTTTTNNHNSNNICFSI